MANNSESSISFDYSIIKLTSKNVNYKIVYIHFQLLVFIEISNFAHELLPTGVVLKVMINKIRS